MWPCKGAIGSEGRPPSSAGMIAFVVAIPRELHIGLVVDDGFSAIHPALDGNESETSGVVLAEFDKRGFHQIEGVAIPEIHLLDPPFAREACPAPASCHRSIRRVRSRNQLA